MNTSFSTPTIVTLLDGNVSFLVALSEPVSRVLYRGADLGELSEGDIEALRVSADSSATHNSTDEPRTLTVLPTVADAWSGTPGIEGVVAHGMSEAIYSWARLATSATVQSGRVRFPGLSHGRRCRHWIRSKLSSST